MLFQMRYLNSILSGQTNFAFWISPRSIQKTQNFMKNNNLNLKLEPPSNTFEFDKLAST
jgi:hypothetical protein